MEGAYDPRGGRWGVLLEEPRSTAPCEGLSPAQLMTKRCGHGQDNSHQLGKLGLSPGLRRRNGGQRGAQAKKEACWGEAVRRGCR